jgi:hypothetical protein
VSQAPPSGALLTAADAGAIFASLSRDGVSWEIKRKAPRAARQRFATQRAAVTISRPARKVLGVGWSVLRFIVGDTMRVAGSRGF